MHRRTDLWLAPWYPLLGSDVARPTHQCGVVGRAIVWLELIGKG
jgi:hypothetical protein